MTIPQTMITFDRLKLISTIDNIEILDESAFIEKYEDGVLVSSKYSMKTPYLLSIEVKHSINELVIEFSGKVLESDYPRLISIDTIQQCFDNINALGIVNLNSVAMMNAQVVRCDVTKDIKCTNFKELTDYIRSHIANFKTYTCNQPRNGNLIIETNAMGKTHKRLTIYNKQTEMNNKKQNREYMEQYNITDEFDNICRLEMNLNNKEQIRQLLKIQDNSLSSVLNSTANPIAEFLTTAVPPAEEYQTDLKPYDDFIATCVLAFCDNDLAKVEAYIRNCTPSRGTDIKKRMKRYRDKFESMQSGKTSTIYTDLLKQLS